MIQFLSLADYVLQVSGIPCIERLHGFSEFTISNPDHVDGQVAFGALLHDFISTPTRYVFDMDELEYHCLLGSNTEMVDFFMQSKGGMNFLMSHAWDSNRIVASKPFDDIQLKFALWMSMAIWGNPLGLIPIHASAVVFEGVAILFLGESGTGKSTRSRTWLQMFPQSFLLNDDSPLLRISNDAISVFGSPWSGKTHCYRQQRFPLGAVVRLQRSECDRVSRLDSFGSLAAMLPSCPPALSHVPRCLDHTFRYLETLVAQVPVFNMEFRVELIPSFKPLQMFYRDWLG